MPGLSCRISSRRRPRLRDARLSAVLLLAALVATGNPVLAAGEEPAWRRVFQDPSTGLAFEVPPTFVIGKRRSHARHDLVVDIDSDSLPRAGTSGSLCSVALKEQPEEVRSLDPAVLNAPEAIEQLTQSMRSAMSLLGDVESIGPVAFGKGGEGVAAIVRPRIGPDHDKIRQYIAMADTPTYRITLSCATTAPAIGKARPLFDALVGSVRIDAAR